MISAENIEFAYDAELVLAGVGLDADAGQVVGLIGPNGSGKTTLLRTLYAALKPRAGLIKIDDVELGSLSTREIARRLGVVVQEASVELPVTVADLVLLGRSPHRASFQSYSVEDYEIAAAALTRVGARELADRSLMELSGGEKQRVLIARTLAQRTDHLLLDEPTNHLDIRYQHDILGLVRTLDVTTIVVLHDLNLAARYCSRLILLDGGRVVSSGSPEEVLTEETLQAVYAVGVRRRIEDGYVQLTFRPLAPA